MRLFSWDGKIAVNADELEMARRVSTTDEIQYNCPFPHYEKGEGREKPDKKGRLYVNIRKEKFVCFRCGARGRLIVRVDLDQDRSHELVQKYSKKRVKTPIPNDLRSVWGSESPEERYAMSRIPSHRWNVADMFYTLTDESYSGRLVSVCRDLERGEIRFFEGRTINGAEPKVLSPTSWGKTVLYGLGHIQKMCGRVVLVEGIFDAECTPMGVGMMGKKINQDQLDYLRMNGIRETALVLDSDADDLDIKHNMNSLTGRGFKVVPLRLKVGDPGELGWSNMNRVVNTLGWV